MVGLIPAMAGGLGFGHVLALNPLLLEARLALTSLVIGIRRLWCLGKRLVRLVQRFQMLAMAEQVRIIVALY